MLSEAEIADAVIWACRQEVMAPKPGNVNCFSDGHNMHVDDFIASAHAIAPVMATRGLSVGERIKQAIDATQAVVSSNTNLGIVLLFAPLCCAIEDSNTPQQLFNKLTQVLLSLDCHDARLCYQAIRKARAGGLGKAEQQDVANEPNVTLLQAMALAAERDLIARQYTNNYRDILQLLLPTLTNALRSGEGIEWATALAYLYSLSMMPDSLICRKQSRELAEAVSEKAREFMSYLNENNRLEDFSDHLTAWDNELKQKAINPGTSADLIAATLLIHAFQERLSLYRISVP